MTETFPAEVTAPKPKRQQPDAIVGVERTASKSPLLDGVLGTPHARWWFEEAARMVQLPPNSRAKVLKPSPGS